MTYPVHISAKKIEKCIDLLLITDANKPHYVHIKDFNRFICNKTKNKCKKQFCRYCLKCFTSEWVLIKNGKQSVKLKIGSVKLKKHFKHLAVPFKTYAGFESILKKIHSDKQNNNVSCTENYQDHIPCSFVSKVICIYDKFSKEVVFYTAKNAVSKFIEAILEKYEYCKGIIKKHLRFCSLEL